MKKTYLTAARTWSASHWMRERRPDSGLDKKSLTYTEPCETAQVAEREGAWCCCGRLTRAAHFVRSSRFSARDGSTEARLSSPWRSSPGGTSPVHTRVGIGQLCAWAVRMHMMRARNNIRPFALPSVENAICTSLERSAWVGVWLCCSLVLIVCADHSRWVSSVAI